MASETKVMSYADAEAIHREACEVARLKARAERAGEAYRAFQDAATAADIAFFRHLLEFVPQEEKDAAVRRIMARPAVESSHA